MSAADYEAAAARAALAGGAVLRRAFARGAPRRVETKGLNDFVTEIDRESEAAVVETLRSRFPDHAIMAEEGSPTAEAGGYRWVIDPLDGTTNFIHGVPTFGVSVALEDGAGLVAAAIHDPLRGETFCAHRGGGAHLDGTPIRCSDRSELTSALIATGFPYREMDRLAPYLEVFRTLVRGTAGLRRAGAACLDLAYTACGRYDGFFEFGLSRWDIAAGALLVREAGGAVTDLAGGSGFLDSGDIVAAGIALHPLLVDVTRDATA